MRKYIDHGHSQSRDALRALQLCSTEIAQYLRRSRNNIDHGHSQSGDALRATEKKVSFNTRQREPELPILVYSIFGPDMKLDWVIIKTENTRTLETNGFQFYLHTHQCIYFQ